MDDQFHAVGYVVAVLFEAALLAAALVLVPRRRGRTVAFPAALVLAEAARGVWPLGGLPLAGIDLGQVGGPLAPAARLGGRLLVVALVAIGAMGLALLTRRRGGVLWGVAALAVVGLVSTIGAFAPDGSPRDRLVVAVVQGGGARGIRAGTHPPEPLPASHLRASQSVASPVDLVVWPESAVDVEGTLPGSTEDEAVAALARRLDTTVIAGVIEDADGRPRAFSNAAVAWAQNGVRVARYDKVHRVPFGEYVPARRWFEGLVDLSAVPRDLVPGRGPGVLDTPAGRMGVVISYEVFFAERARAAIRAGGGILVVPTNASSYRQDQVPGQELAAARLRALETGRWVVQAAPTGYSAVIDHHGRVLARTDLGEAAVLQRTVEVRTGQTVAVRLGTTPLVAAAGVGLAGAWTLRASRQRCQVRAGTLPPSPPIRGVRGGR